MPDCDGTTRARQIARRLAQLESPHAPSGAMRSVLVHTRACIETLAGHDGADALLLRAIHLARREMRVPVEERPRRNERAARDRNTSDIIANAIAVDHPEKVLVHLLALVIAFIGDAMTLAGLRSRWPSLDASAGPDQEDTAS